MERTYIKDLRGKLDQTVKLQGWLQTLRDQKKMQFLILRDPTGLVQVAHWKPNNEELAARIGALSAETALTITGKVVLPCAHRANRVSSRKQNRQPC